MKFLSLNKKHFFLLALTFVLVLMSTFHQQAQAGVIKKRFQKKVRPRPHTWRTSSPPIKTPDKSAIVAHTNPYQQCRATVMPAFINRSMGFGSSNYPQFKALSPPSILVNSAGNSYPHPTNEAQSQASRDYDAIFVGSMSPEGIKSGFSQEGEAVHIMAPSDHHLTSATSTGHYRKYGGTSGAAPLVTGSLAGFEWLAGYHPTAKEAKLLLEKTAIPTPYSKDKPRKNGVGMVNAYKLAMVAKRLKKACGNNIACFKDMINKADTYQFPENPDLGSLVDEAFPQCSSTCTAESLNNQPSCANKAEVFKALRKEAFLNPENKDLWKKIACIYAEGGFTKNKEGALNIYNTLSGNPNRTIEDALKKNNAYKNHCKQDTDCVLAKECDGIMTKGEGSPPSLIAINKSSLEDHYLNCLSLSQDRKIPLCNGKCRCGPTETIVESNEGGTQSPSKTIYKALCSNFQCITAGLPPPLPPGPSLAPLPPSGGSGSSVGGGSVGEGSGATK